MIKLKPVIYTTNYRTSGSQNDAQQKFLLKALQVTQDPKELRKMIGVRTVAEVYRTLDKMGMRKEYHKALAKMGISFEFMVKGIKDIAVNAYKDGDKLKAYQTLLRSTGMDKYEDSTGGGEGSWEEILVKKIEEEKAAKEIGATSISSIPVYEVKQPELPDSVKKSQEEEDEMTSSLYDSK